MKHEIFTRKLKRTLEKLCTETFRAVPRELYVFGSYARGAEEPGDLDLLFVYDLPACYDEELERHRKAHGGLIVRGKTPRDEYARELRRNFSRPKVDITYDECGRILDDIRERSVGCKIPFEELVLLWTRKDQDWEPKINAIRINPEASRATREPFPETSEEFEYPSHRSRCENIFKKMNALTGELNRSGAASPMDEEALRIIGGWFENLTQQEKNLLLTLLEESEKAPEVVRNCAG
jgi:predicted nucleotidyltransferase